MSNALVVTSPGEGHVAPMFSVVDALVRRGHRVTWYTGRVYRERVERAGATFLPMRAGYDFGGMSREQAFPGQSALRGVAGMTEGFRDAFLTTAPAYLDDLTEFVDSTPVDLMITDETSFAAGLLAEMRDIPVAWVSTSAYLPSSRDTAPFGLGLAPSASPLGRLRNRGLHVVANLVVLRKLRRAGADLRRRVGLHPLPAGAFENIVRPPELYLMATAPSLEYPRSDLPDRVRFVGALGTPSDSDFAPPAWWGRLKASPAVVHVTQGTVADDAERLLLPAIRALAGTDTLVVVTTGVDPGRLRLDPLPSNVIVARFVPHAHLLPHVDVMVTNGGYGGAVTAASHGVPLVIAAASEEKREVAARVAWSGVGVSVSGRRAPEARLRRAVERILSDSAFRERAQAVQAELRSLGGPARAADLIEQRLLAIGRRPVQ